MSGAPEKPEKPASSPAEAGQAWREKLKQAQMKVQELELKIAAAEKENKDDVAFLARLHDELTAAQERVRLLQQAVSPEGPDTN